MTKLNVLDSKFTCTCLPRSVLQEVLNQKDKFQSLKQDVLPYLVRTQLVSLVMLLTITLKK